MLKEELQSLEVDKITPEQARIYSTEIIRDTITENKAAARRQGFVTAILVAAGIIAQSVGASTVSYGLWGMGSYFFTSAMQKVSTIRLNSQKLKQFAENPKEEDYRDFLRLCQNYSENQVEKQEPGKAR